MLLKQKEMKGERDDFEKSATNPYLSQTRRLTKCYSIKSYKSANLNDSFDVDFSSLVMLA